MKKSWFTDRQVMAVSKRLESRIAVGALSREYNVSTATLYQEAAKHGDVNTSMIKRLK